MFVPLYVIWWKIFVDKKQHLFRYNEDYLLAILIIILT